MKFFLIILLCLTFITDAKEKVLFRVGFGDHIHPPYAFIENGKLTSGIIKEINDAISKELDVDVEYIYTPRKRQTNLYLVMK